ncbi:hypothetical protein Taro_042438 [Colocasia esculenta]|uniref:DNA mismatch repair protein MSH2 n=1 Tax=Colocasia esculenta TaxID=4460 RepID=A0A843WWH6_COLES|nr:hypothetical protein [Colocasia esculenta]
MGRRRPPHQGTQQRSRKGEGGRREKRKKEGGEDKEKPYPDGGCWLQWIRRRREKRSRRQRHVAALPLLLLFNKTVNGSGFPRSPVPAGDKKAITTLGEGPFFLFSHGSGYTHLCLDLPTSTPLKALQKGVFVLAGPIGPCEASIGPKRVVPMGCRPADGRGSRGGRFGKGHRLSRHCTGAPKTSDRGVKKSHLSPLLFYSPLRGFLVCSSLGGLQLAVGGHGGGLGRAEQVAGAQTRYPYTPPTRTIANLAPSFSPPSLDHRVLCLGIADARQAQGFISFFKTLPHDPRAVRFFDRRDYYTVHGENAIFIAKTYYHTSSALRQLSSGADGISSVSVSKNMFETIARDLLLERTDHILELYEGSGSNWRLSKTGTPGRLGSFEDILFANNDMHDSPAIVALCLSFRDNQSTVGLSFIDMTRRIIGITEFLDDSQFTNVESVLVALGCKECLLPMEGGKSAESKTLHDALGRCGVLLTERKKTEFKSRDLVQDLGRVVRGSTEPIRDLLSEFDCALGALGALLLYVDVLGDDSNYGSYTLQKYNLGNYVRLDSIAIKALNVFERKTDANKNFSLFGLMNRTCTAGMGKRLLNRWLKQPLLDVHEINCRLDLVQAFVEDAELRQGLRQHLKRIQDIERLTHSLKKKSANLQPVIKLYQSSIRLPHIKDVLKHYKGQFSLLIKQKYLDALEFWMDENHLSKFIALVEASVDLDQLENGEYMISSDYDQNLAALKEELNAIEQKILSLHRQTADDLDLITDKSLKLEKGTQFGHVFRITKKEEQKVRRKLNTNFIVLETRKDGVKFTNSKLKKLGDHYQHVLSDYSKCQKELVARVVETAATFSEVVLFFYCKLFYSLFMVFCRLYCIVFETFASILSELDVLASFADLAVSCPTPYTRPDITPSFMQFFCFAIVEEVFISASQVLQDEGDIILEGSRHPCVEAQDGINFIPNDCTLVRGKSWFQIITGPNMGGKSTFIRQLQ